MIRNSSVKLEIAKDESRGVRVEPPDFTGDSSRINKQTGWHATVSFEQSIMDLLVSQRVKKSE